MGAKGPLAWAFGEEIYYDECAFRVDGTDKIVGKISLHDDGRAGKASGTK